jgi:hypothetical protein
MTRITVRLLLAIGLIGMGWAVGRAQEPLPDFEFVIDAPEGRTTIECVRGCQGLAWIERMKPGTVPTPTQTVFSYECSNFVNARCQSGRVGGWLKH